MKYKGFELKFGIWDYIGITILFNMVNTILIIKYNHKIAILLCIVSFLLFLCSLNANYKDFEESQ